MNTYEKGGGGYHFIGLSGHSQNGILTTRSETFPARALTPTCPPAILASDDWTTSRAARGPAAESDYRGCGRGRLLGASSAFHLRRAGRTPQRSLSPDPHARPRRCSRPLRFCFFARKTFLRTSPHRFRRRPFSSSENIVRHER